MSSYELVDLKKVCEIDKKQVSNVGLPYVGLEDIESGTGRFIGSLSSRSVKSSTFVFNENHLLYGRLRPYLNKVLSPAFSGHCSTEIFPIKVSSSLMRSYLMYWFVSQSTVDKINSTCTGARMPRANMEAVFNFQIPIPPLPEQKSIVSILDTAFTAIDKAIANTEKNIKNAQELFESYLNKVFSEKGEGWEEKRLGEVANMSYGHTAKSCVQKIGPKFLRITDITSEGVNWNNVPFCNSQDVDYEKYKLRSGDIVFARTGATTGKSFLVIDPPEAVFASYLIKLSLKENQRIAIVPEFLILFFQTKDYWDTISMGISGSAQGGFNASKLSNLLVPIPSQEIQKFIISKAFQLNDKNKKLSNIFRHKIDKLNVLKQSLLQKAFTGELTSKSLENLDLSPSQKNTKNKSPIPEELRP